MNEQEVWVRLQEMTKEFIMLKEELEEQAPDTLRSLAEDMANLLEEMEELYSYYAVQ